MTGPGWRDFLRRAVFELVVIFAGVYGAFAMAEWQEGREAAERRAQVYQALVRRLAV